MIEPFQQINLLNSLAFVWYERNGEERNKREIGKFSCLVRREIEKKKK